MPPAEIHLCATPNTMNAQDLPGSKAPGGLIGLRSLMSRVGRYFLLLMCGRRRTGSSIMLPLNASATTGVVRVTGNHLQQDRTRGSRRST